MHFIEHDYSNYQSESKRCRTQFFLFKLVQFYAISRIHVHRPHPKFIYAN